MTHDEFDDCMQVLCAGVGRRMEPATVVVWRECLEQLDCHVLRRAIAAALRDWTFGGFPPIGFVADRCGMPKSTIGDDHQAVVAWHTVYRAISKYGGYVSIDWGDAAIKAAIETVADSWVGLSGMETADLVRFIKPKFIEAWKAHKAAGTSGDTVTCGIHARDAARLGFTDPEVIRIGDETPKVIGFGIGDRKALPERPPEQRIAAVQRLAIAMNVPDDEETTVTERHIERRPVPSAEETRDIYLAQRRALEVKYGIAAVAETADCHKGAMA